MHRQSPAGFDDKAVGQFRTGSAGKLSHAGRAPTECGAYPHVLS